MCARCALVRRTLATLAAAPLFSSGDDEQPTKRVTASAAASPRVSEDLFRICGRQLRPMPPAAAERLEQRCGIGKSVRLRLHEIEPRLPVGLIRVQHGEIACISIL